MVVKKGFSHSHHKHRILKTRLWQKTLNSIPGDTIEHVPYIHIMDYNRI
jgi:hypothetical protein